MTDQERALLDADPEYGDWLARRMREVAITPDTVTVVPLNQRVQGSMGSLAQAGVDRPLGQE